MASEKDRQNFYKTKKGAEAPFFYKLKDKCFYFTKSILFVSVNPSVDNV